MVDIFDVKREHRFNTAELVDWRMKTAPIIMVLFMYE